MVSPVPRFTNAFSAVVSQIVARRLQSSLNLKIYTIYEVFFIFVSPLAGRDIYYTNERINEYI